jgi:hypothetical protein
MRTPLRTGLDVYIQSHYQGSRAFQNTYLSSSEDGPDQDLVPFRSSDTTPLSLSSPITQAILIIQPSPKGQSADAGSLTRQGKTNRLYGSISISRRLRLSCKSLHRAAKVRVDDLDLSLARQLFRAKDCSAQQQQVVLIGHFRRRRTHTVG